jgi:cbb3-type cytochrome oxidase subunit 1
MVTFWNSNSNYANVLDESYGTLYLIGMFTLVYNIIQTVRLGSKIEDELAEALS